MRLSYAGGIILSRKSTAFTHITGCSIVHPEMTLKMDKFSDTRFQQVPLTCFITLFWKLDQTHLNNWTTGDKYVAITQVATQAITFIVQSTHWVLLP